MPCISGRPGRSATFQNDSDTPSAAKALLDEVVVADRGAAGRHQHVCAGLPRAPDRGNGVVDAIGNDAEIDHLRAFTLRQRRDGIAVGIDDLAGAGFAACHDQFVAGRKHRDLGAAGDRDGRVVGGGGERHVAAGEETTARQKDVAGFEIEAGAADVLVGGCRFLDSDAVAVAFGMFLDGNRIGARRHDAAGEDPHRFARTSTAPAKGRPAATSPVTFNATGAAAISAARTA